MGLSRALLATLSLALAASAHNYTAFDMMQMQKTLLDDRPEGCPPCFNCHLPAYSCGQFSPCNEYNGKCDCPEGFGGDDCLQPLCGSLARGSDRPIRDGTCDCDEGWTGINCNVCTNDQSCDALMPTKDGGICYSAGSTVKHHYQMCDVTNKKIVEILEGKVPQVTFDCKKNAEGSADETCDFQFWVDQRESFMCHLTECSSTLTYDADRNKTQTAANCKKVECECVPNRMLCGENGSVDITDFLKEEIAGPASFKCVQESHSAKTCTFEEPQMDQLITDLFGDPSISLTCRAGECLYHTAVPGYAPNKPKINTPLIAGVIAGCSLFLVAVGLLTWYLSRRRFRYGAIRLDDSDDEGVKLMADHKPASLYFEDVSYSLNGRQILGGIRGVAHPGEVTAIMGASGAGKTSFLDILARKNKRGSVGGNFYVNGERVGDAEYKRAVGFVDQEDTMLPTLTVHETILTSALLRLPRDMGLAAKEQRVFEVEKQLGIWHIRDSLIGSEEGKGRGISGGEKRRVGIACELVTSPSILFLDEPTSGLDAYNAYNVVECLVALAKTYQRTVIFTIHQPRSNIVALFDRQVLLAQGRMVYSGPQHQCQAYFDRVGYSCPPGFNIADYLVDLTMHAGTMYSHDDGTLAAEVASGGTSTRAVKSVASLSGASIGEDSVAGSTRPRHRRRDSVRLRQERELYTRRRLGPVDTAASSDTGVDEPGAVKLHDQDPRKVPQQEVDHIHDSPPAAAGSDLDVLVRSYAQSDIATAMRDEIRQAVVDAQSRNGHAPNGHGPESNGTLGKGYARIGYIQQFKILSQRTWRNLYRNPMLMLTHYAISIVLAVFAGYLFYGLTVDISGFQNRLGLFFFALALFGFSTLTSLNTFSSERLLFLRERANGYYSPITYFAAKVLFDIVPLRIIPPILLGIIIYPMTGLMAEPGHFFIFILVLVLFNFAAAGICLFIGIVCKDSGVANLIGTLVMLFSLLFAGFLLNHNTIPPMAIWLQWLSIYHYGFEALIVNEVTPLTLIDKRFGLDITVPGAAILSSFGFNNGNMWRDIANLGIFGAVFIVLAYGAMHFLLVEKR